MISNSFGKVTDSNLGDQGSVLLHFTEIFMGTFTDKLDKLVQFRSTNCNNYYARTS